MKDKKKDIGDVLRECFSAPMEEECIPKKKGRGKKEKK
jgi:hypothetical protein